MRVGPRLDLCEGCHLESRAPLPNSFNIAREFISSGEEIARIVRI